MILYYLILYYVILNLMHELTGRELYRAIEYAKSIDEEAGRQIISQFQYDQPALSMSMFNMFPAFIAEKNQQMAYLFMDLCFDVICVYQHAFGSTPTQNELSPEWLEKQAELINSELQSLVPGIQINQKLKSKLQDRFHQRTKDDIPQHDLVTFMNEAIDGYAAESNARVDAIKITQAMISVIIRLLGDLYNQTDHRQYEMILNIQ